MSFKYYVPKNNKNPWADYWSKTKIDKEIKSCQDDELLLLIRNYIKKSYKIIDAGCGLGRWVIFLSNLGYDITGVDNYKKAIENLKKYSQSLNVIKADINNLPFEDSTFGAYLSFGVIEHNPNGPEKALSEAHRVLKVGGIIILETPCDNLLRRAKRLFGGIKRSLKELVNIKSTPPIELEFYEYRYKPDELKKYLKDFSFEIIANYPKDLIPDNVSIGLWSDVPSIRKDRGRPFKLNSVGIIIKRILKPFKSYFAGCTVIIAKKV